MVIESYTRATEPILMLVGRLAPEPTDQTGVLVNSSEVEIFEPEMRPLFEFLDVPRSLSEFTVWAQSVGEDPTELKMRLTAEGFLVEITPGDASHVLSQLGPYVLTPEALPDERLQHDSLAAYLTSDGHPVTISRVTATLLWQNPDRVTVGEWLGLVTDRGGNARSMARSIVVDLPRILEDKAASIRNKD